MNILKELLSRTNEKMVVKTIFGEETYCFFGMPQH